MKNQPNLLEYMKKSSTNSKKSHKERVFLDGIHVLIKDQFTTDIDLDKVLNKIKSTIPHFLFQNVEAIYIGQFKELKERELNAAYMDGALYLTNEQKSEVNMLEDIVHEIAHSIEELANFDMYTDNKLNREFAIKRAKLKQILKDNKFDTSKYDFLSIEYNKKFDMYLYEEVGYPILNTLTVGLFCSPYGATSIREYFANGFEFFFLKDRETVKQISPQLYRKLVEIEKGLFFDNIDEVTEDIPY
jgi:hypothetical protein